MMSRLLAIIIACAVSLAAMGADPLEGDWKINGNGATLRFKANSGEGGALDVLWIDGPVFDIAPLTKIGSAVPGAEMGVYDCQLKKDIGKGKRMTSFVLRMDGGDRLSFEAYHKRNRISLWRLVPYLFRVTVVKQANRPSGLDGARRVGAPPAFIVI